MAMDNYVVDSIPTNTDFPNRIYHTSKLKKPTQFYSPSKKPKRCVIETAYEKNEIDVLCVNCMRMVKLSEVEEHSIRCTYIQTEVKLFEQCSPVQQADYKIKKLEESIQRLMKDESVKKNNSKNSYYLQMLEKYCGDILRITDFTKVEILRCREVIYNMSVLLTGFSGSPCIHVYIERLLVISKEKYAQLLNYYKEIAPSISSEKTNEELRAMALQKQEQLRASIYNAHALRFSDKRNYRAFSPTKIAVQREAMEEVSSVAGRDSEDNKSDFEIRSGTSVADISQGEGNLNSIEEKKKAHEAKMKRYFYSLVTNVKKSLGGKCLGYYADTHLLFAEAIKQGKSLDDWQKFVLESLQSNPVKFIEPKKLKKLEDLLKMRAIMGAPSTTVKI